MFQELFVVFADMGHRKGVSKKGEGAERTEEESP